MYTQLQYVGKNLYVIFQEPYLTLDVANYLKSRMGKHCQDGQASIVYCRALNEKFHKKARCLLEYKYWSYFKAFSLK